VAGRRFPGKRWSHATVGAVPNALLPTRVSVLTRRAAITGLAVGASALWAGCTNDDDSGRRRRARRRREAERAAEQDPDIATAAAALADEQAVLDALTATTARHPDLTAMLSPAVEAHGAHVKLLAEAAPDQNPSASSSPAPAPAVTSAPSDVPSGAAYRVPARPPAAVRRLATLEQELSTSAKRHAFAAESGAFARLLASMAASAAQHAVALQAATTAAGDR
jgi:hypothetical protein